MVGQQHNIGPHVLRNNNGFDHLNESLAEILLALELATFMQYTTVSPTRNE